MWPNFIIKHGGGGGPFVKLLLSAVGLLHTLRAPELKVMLTATVLGPVLHFIVVLCDSCVDISVDVVKYRLHCDCNISNDCSFIKCLLLSVTISTARSGISQLFICSSYVYYSTNSLLLGWSNNGRRCREECCTSGRDEKCPQNFVMKMWRKRTARKKWPNCEAQIWMDLIKTARVGVEWIRVAQNKTVLKVKVNLSLYEPWRRIQGVEV